MTRPAHIAALDEALRKAIADEREARERLACSLDQHIDVLDEVDAAIRERVDAYYAIGHCTKAIEKLGYCHVVTVPDDLRLNIQDEKKAARERKQATA
jgi:hypothetical protein